MLIGRRHIEGKRSLFKADSTSREDREKKRAENGTKLYAKATVGLKFSLIGPLFNAVVFYTRNLTRAVSRRASM